MPYQGLTDMDICGCRCIEFIAVEISKHLVTLVVTIEDQDLGLGVVGDNIMDDTSLNNHNNFHVASCAFEGFDILYVDFIQAWLGT
jgi:hypothetical protein